MFKSEWLCSWLCSIQQKFTSTCDYSPVVHWVGSFHWPLICTKNKSCFTGHIYHVLCPFLVWKHRTGLARKNLLDICTLMHCYDVIFTNAKTCYKTIKGILSIYVSVTAASTNLLQCTCMYILVFVRWKSRHLWSVRL